jgi:hypothetical protein
MNSPLAARRLPRSTITCLFTYIEVSAKAPQDAHEVVSHLQSLHWITMPQAES